MRRILTNFHELNRQSCNALLLFLCLISFETSAGELANSLARVSGEPPKTITGIINDSGGIPLPGVSVKVKDKNIGTSTDSNGKFTITLPEGSNVLVISFIGFKAQEVSVEGKSSINISLAEEASTLNEVVVTGYTSQSRNTITTSISKLDTKVLENIPYQNVALAMQGTVAGVRVQSTNGQPGSAPRVLIRGGTSINNPQGAVPLYIVDGVIRNLEDLSADDIESLQVLKDAAATSIYGARGSNGVVLVKTKSGKAGPAKVTYDYSITSSNTLNDYKFVSAREYITATRLGSFQTGRTPAQEAALLADARSYGIGNNLTTNTQWTSQYLSPANQYKLNEGWESMPDPVDPTKIIIFKDTNFYPMVFQTGISHNHYVSATGGSDKATFSAGVGYMYAQGTIKTTDYDRLTLNMNGSVKLKDNLSLSGRINYSGSGDNHAQAFTNIARWNALPGNMKYSYEDGTLAHGRDLSLGNPDYYLPLFDIKGDELSKQKLTASLSSHWEILPGLSFDPQVSLYNQERTTNAFQPAYYSGVAARVLNTARASSVGQGSFRQKQADALFNYKKQFAGKHNLSVVAGMAYLRRDTSTMAANGRGAATDNITTLNASSVPVSVSSSLSQFGLVSYLYGINYDYQQKYLITLNGRYDGASNLGETHKWGFFPGVAVGWNMHEENFWKALPANLLRVKLRASYGVNGNLGALSDYQAQGTYAANSIYSGGSGIQNTVLPNPDLRWEESKTLDFGTDIGLFNSRLNILFDVYNRVTDNLITNLTLPPSTGFGSIATNYGSLESKGVELELNARIFPSTSAFQWETSFNAAQVKNKIRKLPYSGVDKNRVGGELLWVSGQGADAKYEWMGGLQEGGRIGDMFAYKQIGIYATDAEAAAAPTDMLNSVRNNPFGKAAGGDVKWQDTDNNGIIDAKDRVYVGNPYPVWTGGFSNYFSYKNFNLAVRMDYAAGHTIQNALVQLFNTNGIGDVNMTREFYDLSWKQQGDITNVPRYIMNDTKSNYGRTNSVTFVKADYLALREVTLSYIIPVKLMQKVKMNSLKLNLTGTNLHYFRKADSNGITVNNPEDGGQDNGRYSLSRDFILGASLTF